MVASGILGSLIDVGISAVSCVLLIFLLLGGILNSNKKAIKELKNIKKENLAKFLMENGLDTSDDE